MGLFLFRDFDSFINKVFCLENDFSEALRHTLSSSMSNLLVTWLLENYNNKKLNFLTKIEEMLHSSS